jgi:RNA polymerase sigma-70 factor (ECF subfamily)
MHNVEHSKDIITQLYEKYYDTLMKHCLRILSGNEQLLSYAEDIVQETFIEAIQKWGKISDYESHIGWLLTTIKNKTRNILSMHFRRAKHHALSLDDGTEQVIEDREIRIERVLAKQEAAEHLENVLAILTDAEQDAVIMHHEEGMTIPEMAEASQTTEGSQKSALRRAKKKAQRYREKRFFLFGFYGVNLEGSKIDK